MSQISRLRSKTIFRRRTRQYFTDYNELRRVHRNIFKNELLAEDRIRVSYLVSSKIFNNVVNF